MKTATAITITAILLAGSAQAHDSRHDSPPPTHPYRPDGRVTMDHFRVALAPHGSWFYHIDYGRVWRPNVAVQVRSWRPYCHEGRWIWTTDGWYWHSNYEWGAIPFHYGRWTHLSNLGWVWVPDTTWGPSWVHWRYSDAHCGWAPLPPGASVSAGVGLTYHGENVSVSFGFGLTHSDYVFVERGYVCAPQIATVMLAPYYTGYCYDHTWVRYDHHRHHDGPVVYTGYPHEVYVAPRPEVHTVSQPAVTSGGRLSRITSATRTPSTPVATSAPTSVSTRPSSSRISRITSASRTVVPSKSTSSSRTVVPSKSTSSSSRTVRSYTPSKTASRTSTASKSSSRSSSSSSSGSSRSSRVRSVLSRARR